MEWGAAPSRRGLLLGPTWVLGSLNNERLVSPQGRGPLELAQLLQAQCDDPSSPLRASGRTARARTAVIREGPPLLAEQALGSPATGRLSATAAGGATSGRTSKRRTKLGAQAPAPVPVLTPEEERALKELSAEEAELLRLSAEEDGLAARRRVRASRKAPAPAHQPCFSLFISLCMPWYSGALIHKYMLLHIHLSVYPHTHTFIP